MLQTDAGRIEGEGRGEIHDAALLHQRDGLQRGTLAALLANALEDLVEAERGNEQLARCLDCRREEPGVRCVGEVFQPARRVDDVQVRSSSRGTAVSMPRRKPRIFLIGRTGMSSIRSS